MHALAFQYIVRIKCTCIYLCMRRIMEGGITGRTADFYCTAVKIDDKNNKYSCCSLCGLWAKNYDNRVSHCSRVLPNSRRHCETPLQFANLYA